MKTIFKKILLVFGLLLVLNACGNDQISNIEKSDKLQVVTTFSILEDMVKNVGGDKVSVHNMVPLGTDPHEYTPLPLDIQKATDADIIFYNGLNLEDGDGWFKRLIENVDKKDEQVVLTTSRVQPKYLTSSSSKKDEINPHAFLDVNVGIIMVENIRDALIKADEDNKEIYESKARDYLKQLEEINLLYEQKIEEIPEENRILITSEHAYQYMADRYGLKAAYLWEIDTDEQGTPSQITSLVNFIKENDVKALFVESNVDPRPMETVSKETGVKIAAKLFSDELGKKGEAGDSYINFLKYNIEQINNHLK